MSSNQRPTLTRWLTIVGIGEDGAAGLSDEAKRLIGEAEIVFGGKRHLALAKTSIKGEGRAWPSPFDAAMREVVALRGRKVCVLASGDPFLHGVGATLARHVPADEMIVVPAPSAFSLAACAARLGAAGCRDGVAAWPCHRSDPPAAAAEAPRAGADLGRRRAKGRGRRC